MCQTACAACRVLMRTRVLACCLCWCYMFKHMQYWHVTYGSLGAAIVLGDTVEACGQGQANCPLIRRVHLRDGSDVCSQRVD